MEHLAIMRKSWELTQKIMNGQKKIESRWYSVKCRPWDRIKEGEAIYFKDSGEPVKLKAEVSKGIQFFLINLRIIKPFEIDKTGYGIMSSWITVDSIARLKKKTVVQ